MDNSRASMLSVLSLPFQENSYIAFLEGSKQAIVVDPGLEPDKIFAVVDEHELEIVAVLCTHGHSDHIAGNAAMKDRWPAAPLVIGAGDAYKLTDPQANLSAGYGVDLISPEADRTVVEGEVLDYANLELEVLETPGHSAGHVVFVARKLNPIQVLGGDVLFAGGIGRTDFPDGSFADLKQSIQEKLFILPEDTIVLPGHGPPTTIGAEKQGNPYVGLNSRFNG